MYIYLSKLLPLMVLPIGVVLEFSLLALVFLVKGKKKTAATFMVMAVLVLWVSSMPVVADALLGRMEQDYPAVMITEVPASQCIVVLGGTIKPAAAPMIDIDMTEAVDRLRKAAQLYRAGLGQTVIVAGGNQPWSPVAEPEAAAMKTLLLEWGVQASDIVLEGSSRNTRENALNSIALLDEMACGTPLLVTSAAHMKRSVAVFEKLGMDVTPVSSDVRVSRRTRFVLMDYLPDAEALKKTTDAMREWIGQKVYEVRGWN